MKLKVWLALWSVYIIWGSTYLAIRIAVETIPPFLMAAARMLAAGVILYAWMMASGAPKPTRREWKVTGVIGVFLLVGGNGLVTWSEQRLTSSVAAVIIGSMPLWIVLLDAIRPGGIKPHWLTVAGVLIGFLGIVILIDPFNLSQSSQSVDMIGALALVLAALSWSIGSIYGRENHAQLPKTPLLVSGMEMLIGGLGLLLVGTLTGEWSRLNLAAISPNSLFALGYLIFFGSIIAFASFSWLLGAAPTPLVATYAYVNPLVAIVLGNLIAQEPISLRLIFSTLLIIGAVVLINMTLWLRSRRAASVQNTTI